VFSAATYPRTGGTDRGGGGGGGGQLANWGDWFFRRAIFVLTFPKKSLSSVNSDYRSRIDGGGGEPHQSSRATHPVYTAIELLLFTAVKPKP